MVIEATARRVEGTVRGKGRDRVEADSEIRTHDGALQDDFSEQNQSWDDSGTIISET